MMNMKVTNWGLFLLGIYLVVLGLISLFPMQLFGLHSIVTLVGLAAGILIIMENYKK